MICLWIYSQFTLKSEHASNPEQDLCSDWSPWDWRKLSQVNVTWLFTRQVFSPSFQSNAFCLRLILRNSSVVPPVCITVLLHSALAKLNSGVRAHTHMHAHARAQSLFPQFKVIQPSSIAVSRRKLVLQTCDSALLLGTAGKFTISTCILQESNEST